MSRRPPPPPKWIYVDVDGTLSLGGLPNESLLEWLQAKKADGFRLVLWSARGQAHARAAAELFECSELFEAILAKPGYVVDDRAWSWIKWTRVVRSLSNGADE
jgi:hypothetical protein